MFVLFKGIRMPIEDLNLLYQSQLNWRDTKGFTDSTHVLHVLEQLKTTEAPQ